MGFFDKFRRKKQEAESTAQQQQRQTEPTTASSQPSAFGYDTEAASAVQVQSYLPEPATMLLGFALLNDDTFDATQLVEIMREQWGITIADLQPDDNMVFELGGMNVAIAHMPGPVPNREVEENCKFNVLWPEAEQVVATHQSHVIITVMGITDVLLGHALFTQLTSSILQLSNAIAYYAPPMVMSAESYVESAEILKEQELPVQLWVFLGLYKTEDGSGSGAYTVGLKNFGKDELEIIDSKQSIEDVFEFTLNIISYVVGSNVVLHDGETLGYSEDQKLSLTKSPAVAMEGESIKIGF
ncbi:DUF4261 domain-containing protein [Paenibacillus sp. WLX2291]|uniref:DUF4261 domain-containing protein n=1 Tax=Paenibacillus sp. WLX2291 TaxID=3296934 RepID=UPI00398431C5